MDLAMARSWIIGLMTAVMLVGSATAATKAAPKKPAAKPPAAKPVPPTPAPVLATPLQGEPQLFAVFRTICLDHQGDLGAAETEARKQGFVIVPPDPDEDPDVAKTRTMLKRDSADLPLVVILIHAPPEVVGNAPNAEATLCSLNGPDSAGASAAAAKAWVGPVASSQDGNHLTYIYRQTASQRFALTEEATVRAAIATSEYRVFDIDPEDAGVTLGLLTGLTRALTPAG